MARLIEQVLAIKFSKIIKDTDTDESVITQEQVDMLMDGLPTIVEEILGANNVIIEVMEIT